MPQADHNQVGVPEERTGQHIEPVQPTSLQKLRKEAVPALFTANTLAHTMTGNCLKQHLFELPVFRLWLKADCLLLHRRITKSQNN